jgi:carbonic anhydrase
MNPQEALNSLKNGNLRFASGKPRAPRRGEDRRRETLTAQQPLAAVLTCSDSRVAPEILFDQGIGDLFVVRTAGNVADDTALASLEYAVCHLHVPLVVVMGHSRCGAVTAALHGEALEGHLPGLLRRIAPALEKTRNRPGDPLTNAVDAHVLLTVEQLRTCQPVLAPAFQTGKAALAAARYDLEGGKVAFLD